MHDQLSGNRDNIELSRLPASGVASAGVLSRCGTR